MRSTHEVKGVLKVAAPESLTISRLGPIIREYSLKYPNVKLILTNGTCGQNQIDLMSGRVDVAFIVFPEIKPEKSIHYSLVEEKIVLVSGKDGPDHFDEYKNKNTRHFYITNEEGCSYRSMFERYFTLVLLKLKCPDSAKKAAKMTAPFIQLLHPLGESEMRRLLNNRTFLAYSQNANIQKENIHNP